MIFVKIFKHFFIILKCIFSTYKSCKFVINARESSIIYFRFILILDPQLNLYFLICNVEDLIQASAVLLYKQSIFLVHIRTFSQKKRTLKILNSFHSYFHIWVKKFIKIPRGSLLLLDMIKKT